MSQTATKSGADHALWEQSQDTWNIHVPLGVCPPTVSRAWLSQTSNFTEPSSAPRRTFGQLDQSQSLLPHKNNSNHRETPSLGEETKVDRGSKLKEQQGGVSPTIRPPSNIIDGVLDSPVDE